jgi:hypothetical protein
MVVASMHVSSAILAGQYNKDDYRTSLVGTSDCNQYIPFYSLFFHEFITFKDSPERIIEYSLPVARNNYMIRRYDQLLSALVTTQNTYMYQFTLQGVQHRLFVNRGIIFNGDGVILLCLGIDVSYILGNTADTIRNQFDKTKLVLFVSNEFNNNPIYKNVRKKLELEFMSSCREQNIDMVTTNDINKWVFKNNFEMPKFKSIKEMNGFLKETLPKNLLIK